MAVIRAPVEYGRCDHDSKSKSAAFVRPPQYADVSQGRNSSTRVLRQRTRRRSDNLVHKVAYFQFGLHGPCRPAGMPRLSADGCGHRAPRNAEKEKERGNQVSRDAFCLLMRTIWSYLEYEQSRWKMVLRREHHPPGTCARTEGVQFSMREIDRTEPNAINVSCSKLSRSLG